MKFFGLALAGDPRTFQRQILSLKIRRREMTRLALSLEKRILATCDAKPKTMIACFGSISSPAIR